jgi:hypothetical protein
MTYLTTDELAARIKYEARTIRDRLKDTVLLERVHYIRPFGGRKILYLWEAIERDMAQGGLSMGMGQPLRPNPLSSAQGPEQSRATSCRSRARSTTRPAMGSHVGPIPMASGEVCHV